MVSLTSVEIKHWLDEQKNKLEGARLEKVWQVEDIFIMRFYVPFQGNEELVVMNNAIFFTDYEIKKPLTPPPFVMTLRKYLSRQRVKKVSQYGLDRIIILEFPQHYLIIELMIPTLIVLTDKDYTIVALSKRIESGKRLLRVREKYAFPPSKRNILLEKEREFLESVKNVEDISSLYGISPHYVRYAVSKYGISKEAFNFLQRIFREKRVCVHNDNVYGFCIHDQRCTYFNSLNEAIQSLGIKEIEKIEVDKCDDKVAKDENKRLIYMQEGLKRLKQKKSELEKIAEFFSVNPQVLHDIIRQAQKGEVGGYIAHIDFKTKKAKVKIQNSVVEIDYSLSFYNNLSLIYEEIKKIKEKIKNLENIIQKERKNIKEKVPERTSSKSLILKKKEKKYWYEKFRWFITSRGNLFVLGKDAATNDILLRKYREKDDIVFHSHLPGSGFGLLKIKKDLKADSGEIDVEEEEAIECAQFVVSYSYAWKMGVGVEEVYWVRAHQIGEKIKKGMYMIYGKRNFLKVSLELSFGIVPEEKKVIFGPFSVVRKLTDKYVVIVPGSTKASVLAEKIRDYLSQWDKNTNILENYDEEFFREKIPFGYGDIRKKSKGDRST